MRIKFKITVLLFLSVLFLHLSCSGGRDDMFETPDESSGVSDGLPDEAPDVDGNIKKDEQVHEEETALDEESNAFCGNGVVDAGEVCDTSPKDCKSLDSNYSSGLAECKKDCSDFDTSTCQTAPVKDVYAVDSSKCPGCRRCLSYCSENAISMVSGKAVIDPNKCTGCGDCESACRFGAIKKK